MKYRKQNLEHETMYTSDFTIRAILIMGPILIPRQQARLF